MVVDTEGDKGVTKIGARGKREENGREWMPDRAQMARLAAAARGRVVIHLELLHDKVASCRHQVTLGVVGPPRMEHLNYGALPDGGITC